MSIVKKVKDISADIQSVSGFGSAVCDAIAMGLYDKGYRANIKNIDEFVKKLKDKMNNLSRMEYGGVPYFLVSKSFIDKIVEEMKGGAE